jgi:hypothetical protein
MNKYMGYISVYNPWTGCTLSVFTAQKPGKNIKNPGNYGFHSSQDLTLGTRSYHWQCATTPHIHLHSVFTLLQQCNMNTSYMMQTVHHIQSLIHTHPSAAQSILRHNHLSSVQATPFLTQIFITMKTRACCFWPLSWVSPHHHILVLDDPFS